MGSHIVEVLRQGIWASLSGGWFYDPRQTVFCNGLHLYLWLFLVFLPFTINLLFSFTTLSIAIYCLVTLVLSCVIKIGVKYLHGIFDTHEFTEEDAVSQATTTAHTKEMPEITSCEVGEVMEMPVLTRQNSGPFVGEDIGDDLSTFTGPNRILERGDWRQSHHKSFTDVDVITSVPIATSDSSQSSDQDAMVSVKSADAIASRKSDSGVTEEKYLDLKVDVHRRNSSGSGESSEHNSDHEDLLSGSKSPLLNEEKAAKLQQRCKSSVTTPELHTFENVEVSETTLTTSRSDSRIQQQRPSVTFLTQSGGVSTSNSSTQQMYRRNSSAPAFQSSSEEHFDLKKKRPTSASESNGKTTSVRRTKSYLEPQVHLEEREEGNEACSSSHLSHQIHNQDRLTRARKSYPGKSSSVDIFLNATLRGKTTDASKTSALSTESDSIGDVDESNASIHPTTTTLDEVPPRLLATTSSLPVSPWKGSRSQTVGIPLSVTARGTKYSSLDIPFPKIVERESELDSIQSSPVEGISIAEVKDEGTVRDQRGVISSAPTTSRHEPFEPRKRAITKAKSEEPTSDTYNDAILSDPSFIGHLLVTMEDFREKRAAEERNYSRVVRSPSDDRDSLSTADPTERYPHLGRRRSDTSQYGRKSSQPQGSDATLTEDKSGDDWTFSKECQTKTRSVSTRSRESKRALEQNLRDLKGLIDQSTHQGTSSGERPSRGKVKSSPDYNLSWLFREGEEGEAASSAMVTYRSRSPNTRQCEELRNQLKVEDLKKFLEDMIDSHGGVAWEAIESVRQSRFGRFSLVDERSPGPSTSQPTVRSRIHRGGTHRDRPQGSVNRYSRDGDEGWARNSHVRRRRHPATGISSNEEQSSSQRGYLNLSELLSNPGTHVAHGHDDTSKGAVHCFQDEDGNWWTYTFDEAGVGTAQAIGSSRAVMEMIAAQKTGHSAPGSSHSQPGSSLWVQTGPSARSGIGFNGVPRRSSSPDEWNLLDELPVSIICPAGQQQQQQLVGDNMMFPASINIGTFASRATSSTSGTRRVIGHRNPLQLMVERTLAAATSQAQTTTTGIVATTPGDYSTITGSSSHYPVVSGSMPTSSGNSGSSLNQMRFLNGLSSGGEEFSLRSRPRKRFYRIAVLPKVFKGVKTIKLRFDRLQLLALFDRNRNGFSIAFDVLLCLIVGLLAGVMISRHYYHDVWLVFFCVVAASAQFSLFKSVQPDAASPIHGYNYLVAYSRAIYFCLLCLCVLTIDGVTKRWPNATLRVYNTAVVSRDSLEYTKSGLLVFILTLPIVFTIGLLPQISTFAMYSLEQIEMHIFGGCATLSLPTAAYALGRSLLCGMVLFGISRGTLAFVVDNKLAAQQVPFSIFVALLVGTAYLLSRSSSQPRLLLHWFSKYSLTTSGIKVKPTAHDADDLDLLPRRYLETSWLRLKADMLTVVLIGLLVFALHCSTVFHILQPGLHYALCSTTATIGFLTHYLVPQLRKATPWLVISKPMLRTYEFNMYETTEGARLMWFEKAFAVFNFLERNVLYPLVVMSSITISTATLLDRTDSSWLTSVILVVTGLKLMRTAYCNASQLYVPLAAALLLFLFDLPAVSETFLMDFFCMALLWPKFKELVLKLNFVFVYEAPWQITWGSAFHAFAQPFSVPHSALLLFQSVITSILSAPLSPFLGSALFLSSYMRPIKFWEKDYNTKRVDNSNTRLSSQVDRGPATDDNNLNSIFYEHLTRSLQVYLAGDLMLGRWATPIAPGDCFILASFYLNCLVHVIEVGNGFVTFQLRGLEFRGTYCQQREVEAISEDLVDNGAFCCCEPGHLPGFLSFNTAWSLRWLAWEVTSSKYVLEGYNISDNSAASMLQVYELRKLLVTLYVKCIIYYAVRSPKLEEWLNNNETIATVVQQVAKSERYVDVDSMFSFNIDEDYDILHSGVSTNSFCSIYLRWIRFCVTQSDRQLQADQTSALTILCYCLSLVGRRALGAAAHNRHNSVESFLYGLHSLFKGDFRITCVRDEWVFADMDLLRCVIAPSIRMALKLHQDHFTCQEEFDEVSTLYANISQHESSLFISHEGDPAWRQAVLSNTPSLLALRHVFDDGADEYKIIMLNKRFLNFRVIKLNRECVRGLWAGQQQELIFLRNRNPERGSIQNARQVLRNMINSSADQPIGYPIYVSPLTTSYCETHPQLRRVTGPPVTFGTVLNYLRYGLIRLQQHCGTSGSSSLPHPESNQPPTPAVLNQPITQQTGGNVEEFQMITIPSVSGAVVTSTISGGRSAAPVGICDVSLSESHHSQPDEPERTPPPMVTRSYTHPLRSRSQASSVGTARSSVVSTSGKQNSPRVSLGTLYNSANSKESVVQRVRIIDTSQVLPNLNQPRAHSSGRMLVVWPDESMRLKGGKNHWGKDWQPEVDMEGSVVYSWSPNHSDSARRSHLDKTILLVQIDPDHYVPITEQGVSNLGDEV